MLTKCMSTPQTLARSLSWAGNSGKPSALMAVDIRDDYIGIALAYHRHGKKQSTTTGDSLYTAGMIPTTSINPLPPLPYMSRDPHHPSYSFRCRHRPVRTVSGMPLRPPRVERTMEVALQLAQLASQRSVKSVLVRWPGGGAALGLGGGIRLDNEDWTKGVEEVLLSEFSDRMNIGHKVTFSGTLGYQRGKILYVLDKCCGVHGHNASSLLMEGSRPFALWDTSDDQELITLSSRLDPTQQCAVPHSTPKTNDRLDKYGNSIAEMDQWGRAPIFGMPPDYTWKNKPVKSTTPIAIETGISGVSQFDHFHDAEAKINQLKGSFAAMLTLRDFANTHLEGRVVLPSWVKLHEDTSGIAAQEDTATQTDSEVHVGYRRDNATQTKQEKIVNYVKSDSPPKPQALSKHLQQESRGKLATLVQMPRKRRRNLSEQSTQQLSGQK